MMSRTTLTRNHLLPSSHSSRYTFSKITLPYERLLTWCWHNCRSGLKRSFIDPVRWNRRNNMLIVQGYPLFKTSCYFPLTNVCLRHYDCLISDIIVKTCQHSRCSGALLKTPCNKHFGVPSWALALLNTPRVMGFKDQHELCWNMFVTKLLKLNRRNENSENMWVAFLKSVAVVLLIHF